MTLDVFAIEDILKKESEFMYLDSGSKQEFPKVRKDNYSRLKKEFLEERHEAEFIKLISEFTFQQRSTKELEIQENLSNQSKQKKDLKKEEILNFKSNLQSLSSKVCENHEELEREKDDLVECLARCRELDNEYETIFISSEKLDQNPILNDLKKEIENEKEIVNQLEIDLQKATNEYEIEFNKMNKLDEEMPQLQLQTSQAVERENDAIKISNEKDPQIEELGKWFKESIALLHNLLEINNLSLLSDSKIQIEYFNGEFILNYEVGKTFNSNRLVQVELLKGNLQYQDILEASEEFPNMNLALQFVVNQIYIRIRAQKARKEEIDSFLEKGASYDPSTEELLFQSEISNRCFLFRLDPVYPFGGLKSAKIILIEVMEKNESLSEWNEKMEEFQSITDFLPNLI